MRHREGIDICYPLAQREALNDRHMLAPGTPNGHSASITSPLYISSPSQPLLSLERDFSHSPVDSSSLPLPAMEIAPAHSLASRCSIIASSCCSSCRTSSIATPVVQLKLISSIATRSSLHLKRSFSPLPGAIVGRIRQRSVLRTACASSSEAAGGTSSGVAERWLLQPIGQFLKLPLICLLLVLDSILTEITVHCYCLSGGLVCCLLSYPQ